MNDQRDQISRLEMRIEELTGALERSRKIILISKIFMIAGGAVAVGLLVGVLSPQPLAIIGAVSAILGGIVGFGSSVSTAMRDGAALKAAEAARAELIDRLDLREVGTGGPRQGAHRGDGYG